MTQTVTITPQWQVHIPKKVREMLKLDKPYKAKLTVKDNKIILEPQRSSIFELKGKLKKRHKPGIDIDNIRDYIDYQNL